MASSTTIPKKVGQEIKSCQRSFVKFLLWLRIIDMAGKLSKLRLLPAQDQLLSDLEANPWLIVLKARQLGSTTLIAAWCLWQAMLHQKRVLVVAQSHDAAENIFRIYTTYFENLPKFLQFPVGRDNVRELAFATGGYIKVTTAQSESGRGGRYDIIHCTEVAFWKNLGRTSASLFRAASRVVLESTANGLNEWHGMWTRIDDGFTRRFLSWKDDPRCVSNRKPKQIHPRIQEWKVEYGLSKKQVWWAQKTYEIDSNSDWNLFQQENPCSPEEAFVGSGTRFFPAAFPGVTAPDDGGGLIRYAEPVKYHSYVMGVDPNHGTPNGDFAAFAILDVSDKEDVKTAATFCGYPSTTEFSAMILSEARKYDALVVVESNVGNHVIDFLIENGYAKQYRRTRHNKVENRWDQWFGCPLTAQSRPRLLARLHEYVAKNWMRITDRRLQAEINTFVWNGKRYEAQPPHKDDMIFAFAHAVEGISQVGMMQKHDPLPSRPTGITEAIQYELATGGSYKQAEWADEDSYRRGDVDVETMAPSEWAPR